MHGPTMSLTGQESDTQRIHWDIFARACMARQDLEVLAPSAKHPTPMLLIHVSLLSSKFTLFACSVKTDLGPYICFFAG